MTRRQQLTALAAAALLAGAGFLVGQNFPATAVYQVPSYYYSTGGQSSVNQCAGTNWVNADDPNNIALVPYPNGLTLKQWIRSLPDGSEVDFAANSCTAAGPGINLRNGDPTISFNGNPTNTPGQNAMIFDPDNSQDGQNEVGANVLLPVLQEAGGSGATIEHLILAGANKRAIYHPPLAYSSGILLLGTDSTTVNDVLIRSTFGDCFTVQANNAGGTFQGVTTNLLVEGMTANFCGRQTIAPLGVHVAVFCGMSLGSSPFGNSWDFENDTTGPGQGAENVVITGHTCSYNGVVTSGCHYNENFTVVSNPGQTGPILVDGCVSTGEGSGGDILIRPQGNASGTVPFGLIRFRNDFLECGASSAQACLDVSGPYHLAVTTSTMIVSFSGSPQQTWAAHDSTINSVQYGSQLTFASSCISGFLSQAGNNPPYGHASPLSTYTPINLTYHQGTKTGCS